MGKEKCRFSYMKRLFISPVSEPKSEEKLNKWRWLPKSFKFRQHPSSAVEPPTRRTLNEATEEQRKHAMTVAIATAAAAEAAVAAANAAAEVVWLANAQYDHRSENQQFAAIKIQTAYRGHLARKALSALKGIVKLQAVVRGELVRRSIVRKLASGLSFSKTKLSAVRRKMVLDSLLGEHRPSLSRNEGLRSEELKYLCDAQRSLNVSSASNGSFGSLCLRKHESIAKRKLMRQHSFSHWEWRNDHNLLESVALKETGESCRFDKYSELEVQNNEVTEKLRPLSHSNTNRLTHLKTARRNETLEETQSPFSLARRSLCDTRQISIGDNRSLPGSPIFPAYMAATESAKAKSRSLSTPRQRLRLCVSYSGQRSPYRFGLFQRICQGQI